MCFAGYTHVWRLEFSKRCDDNCYLQKSMYVHKGTLKKAFVRFSNDKRYLSVSDLAPSKHLVFQNDINVLQLAGFHCPNHLKPESNLILR